MLSRAQTILGRARRCGQLTKFLGCFWAPRIALPEKYTLVYIVRLQSWDSGAFWVPRVASSIEKVYMCIYIYMYVYIYTYIHMYVCFSAGSTPK